MELLKELEALPRPPSPIQVELAIEGGSVDHLVLASRIAIVAGPAPRPTFILSAELQDWIEIVEGYASISAALIDGRLRLAGDLGLAATWAPQVLEAIKAGKIRPAPGSTGLLVDLGKGA
jgi:putative sterol carrier protein